MENNSLDNIKYSYNGLSNTLTIDSKEFVPIKIDKNTYPNIDKVKKLVIKNDVFVESIELDNLEEIELHISSIINSEKYMICKNISLASLTKLVINCNYKDWAYISNFPITRLFKSCENIRYVTIGKKILNVKIPKSYKFNNIFFDKKNQEIGLSYEPKSYKFNNIFFDEKNQEIGLSYENDIEEVETYWEYSRLHWKNNVFLDTVSVNDITNKDYILKKITNNIVRNGTIFVPEEYSSCDIVRADDIKYNKLVISRDIYKLSLAKDILNGIEEITTHRFRILNIPYNSDGYDIKKITIIGDNKREFKIDSNEKIIEIKNFIIRTKRNNIYIDYKIHSDGFSEEKKLLIENENYVKIDEGIDKIEINDSNKKIIDFSNTNLDGIKEKNSIKEVLIKSNRNRSHIDLLFLNNSNNKNIKVKSEDVKINKIIIDSGRTNILDDDRKEFDLSEYYVKSITKTSFNYYIIECPNKLLLINPNFEIKEISRSKYENIDYRDENLFLSSLNINKKIEEDMSNSNLEKLIKKMKEFNLDNEQIKDIISMFYEVMIEHFKSLTNESTEKLDEKIKKIK